MTAAVSAHVLSDNCGTIAAMSRQDYHLRQFIHLSSKSVGFPQRQWRCRFTASNI